MAPRLLRRALLGASAALGTAALVLLPALAAGADIHVDDDDPANDSIAAAIAAASAGETIYVAEGNYLGNFTVDKVVTIQGAAAATTIITGTVTVTAPATLTDLTIQGRATPATTTAPYAPTAVRIDAGGAGAQITDNILQNGYHGVYLESVDASSAAPTVISGNAILDIHADQGSSIWISNSSHVVVSDNLIKNTVADSESVGVNLQCNATDVTIDGNTFVNLGNAVASVTIGSCAPISDVVISDNSVDGFSASSAFFFVGNNVLDVTVSGNTVKNTGNPNGAAVKFSGFLKASPGTALDGILIQGNTFSAVPYGVLIEPGAELADGTSISVIGNRIYDTSKAAISNQQATSIVTTGNVFTAPPAPSAGGGTPASSTSSAVQGELPTLSVTPTPTPTPTPSATPRPEAGEPADEPEAAPVVESPAAADGGGWIALWIALGAAGLAGVAALVYLLFIRPRAV